MASAGENITFHVLFLDGLNNRIAVADPTIELFSFDEAGDRVNLVGPGADMAAVEGDAGRYSYTYLIPGDYALGSRIYALMQATDPESGLTIMVEDSSDVYEAGVGGGVGAPARVMTARFIK